MRVQPRPTPADAPLDVEVDEALAVHAAAIEDWVARQPHWELILREGHLFGRTNNVEAELLFVPPVGPRRKRAVKAPKPKR